MEPRDYGRQEKFYGTLEECVKKFGGSAQFRISQPSEFLRGAYRGGRRTAEMRNESILIIEYVELPDTFCDVWSEPRKWRETVPRRSPLSDSGKS